MDFSTDDQALALRADMDTENLYAAPYESDDVPEAKPKGLRIADRRPAFREIGCGIDKLENLETPREDVWQKPTPKKLLHFKAWLVVVLRACGFTSSEIIQIAHKDYGTKISKDYPRKAWRKFLATRTDDERARLVDGDEKEGRIAIGYDFSRDFEPMNIRGGIPMRVKGY